MKIRLSELRALIREQLNVIMEENGGDGGSYDSDSSDDSSDAHHDGGANHFSSWFDMLGYGYGMGGGGGGSSWDDSRGKKRSWLDVLFP